MATLGENRCIGKSIVMICASGLMFACGSASKVPLDGAIIEKFSSFMEQKSFEFRALTAHPTVTRAFGEVANAGFLPPGSNAGTIQIIDISNYIKIYGDSVSGTLPFYGERRLGGGLWSNQGIDFKGVPKVYTQKYNKAKERYEIDFEIESVTGRHEVRMIVFPYKTADVAITGNLRTLMRYSGKVLPLENKKVK